MANYPKILHVSPFDADVNLYNRKVSPSSVCVSDVRYAMRIFTDDMRERAGIPGFEIAHGSVSVRMIFPQSLLYWNHAIVTVPIIYYDMVSADRLDT